MIEPELLGLIEKNTEAYFQNSFWNVREFLRKWELEALKDIKLVSEMKQDEILQNFTNQCRNILNRVKVLQNLQEKFEVKR